MNYSGIKTKKHIQHFHWHCKQNVQITMCLLTFLNAGPAKCQYYYTLLEILRSMYFFLISANLDLKILRLKLL